MRADYGGTGMTVGRHPMAFRRAEMDALGVIRAIAAAPGAANGFVFLSLEDETGVLNAIVTPPTFERYKFQVLTEPFLLIEGVLQNVEGVVESRAAEWLTRRRRGGGA